MTWAPFLVSNFPRIASVPRGFDRRLLLTVNPGRALFAIFRPARVAATETVVRGQIKVFALNQKLGAPIVARALIRNRACPLWVISRHSSAFV
jgi:hypothetical protein